MAIQMGNLAAPQELPVQRMTGRSLERQALQRALQRSSATPAAAGGDGRLDIAALARAIAPFEDRGGDVGYSRQSMSTDMPTSLTAMAFGAPVSTPGPFRPQHAMPEDRAPNPSRGNALMAAIASDRAAQQRSQDLAAQLSSAERLQGIREEGLSQRHAESQELGRERLSLEERQLDADRARQQFATSQAAYQTQLQDLTNLAQQYPEGSVEREVIQQKMQEVIQQNLNTVGSRPMNLAEAIKAEEDRRAAEPNVAEKFLNSDFGSLFTFGGPLRIPAERAGLDSLFKLGGPLRPVYDHFATPESPAPKPRK